jgi:glycosyltransferase involved in cell wall biosynthesis
VLLGTDHWRLSVCGNSSRGGIATVIGPTTIAYIGNSLPRRCGIATFTTDLRTAIASVRPAVDGFIVAMNDPGQNYAYPPEVRIEIGQDDPADYLSAADAINDSAVDVVSLQHEFGIFGGLAGERVVPLLEALKMPIVSTLHTVLADPSPEQRAVFERITALSTRVVVMADKGRELLRTVYKVAADKIDVIPHGIPDMPFVDPRPTKARLGFEGRSVILTFGLLSPNKGIEFMIDAMPAVLAGRPDAVYVVLGATHPNLVRQHGEAYRDSLVERARSLGVGDRVVFLDRFVDRPLLLDYITMCDVYVTPYLKEAQMTSGTLAYSFGLGKAVVSTPYWHARELLADGRGTLVPFGDATALATATLDLLTDQGRRDAVRRRAYASGRSMTWERTAERYLAVFDAARRGDRLRVVSQPTARPAIKESSLPSARTTHFLSLCDDTGILQHALFSVGDRSHGYCVDDNARALLVSCALDEKSVPDVVSARFAAFIQHAWNPGVGRFRNFMSFDRRWLEDRGSEDSHGRTLWALGVCARDDRIPSRRLWAADLFHRALPTVEGFTSPRAWAFTLLGLDAMLDVRPDDDAGRRIRRVLSGRLMDLLAAVETPDWIWFEEYLGYDNARLSEALIVSGIAADDTGQVQAGLRTLRWLMRQQTTSTGLFRPVGSDSFGERRRPPRPFDQQPLEAAATMAACLAARSASPDSRWLLDAQRAYDWFLGANDLGVPLVDVSTGSCRDGLHPDRANENRGAESTISYLLALADNRRLAQMRDPRDMVGSRKTLGS